jgi:hypothetical protein
MNTNVMTTPITLNEVLTYRHSGVVRRYAREHQVSLQVSAEIFGEMLKYLYLSHCASMNEPENFGCVVSAEIEKIDWMWHTFLLFTQDYAEFCDRHFGVFLHHVPNDEEGVSSMQDPKARRAMIERQFGFVYDILGESTLRTWYDERRYAASV